MLSTDNFDRMYDGSWYTITGCGGNLEEWKEGYAEMLNEQGVGNITEWIHFTGKDMNDICHLTGDNRYKDDLNFLAFPLEGMNIGMLAVFKLRMGDRWFDDIVDNNVMREFDK